jgi:hypothetical protein
MSARQLEFVSGRRGKADNLMADHENGPNEPKGQDAPVGAGDYVVQPGDCVSSIAYEHGHLWQTILNHPANSEVKAARSNHNVLLPGDRLTIPPVRRKEESAETDKRHTFRLKGVPEMFRLRLLDQADQPRADLPYVLVIGERTFKGTTNSNGELQHPIPPDARQAHLTVDSGDDVEEIELQLGNLNPRDTVTGVQSRLTNLGFDCGPVDGILGPKTRKAIMRFQRQVKIEPTGELDNATIQQLENRHGS